PAPRDGEVVTIPVAFHVIYSGGTGNVPEQQVIDQIDVLNTTFESMGYRFVLAVLNRVENSDWFFNARDLEAQMKSALAVDPARFLNIYSAGLSGGLLGWAYFPNSFAEDAFLHGAVILYTTLPGGSLSGYETGETAVHEVGHYVGLFHTFQGGCVGGDTAPGCETGGDQVCDTPAEASPAFGCPGGRDTCPTGEDDPIENFMDYTLDPCKTEFTAGQAERAFSLMSQFRPTIMSNPTGFASPSELDFDDVGVGASDTQVAVVVNLSEDPFEVTSLSTDNGVFTVGVTSLTVPPLSVEEVEVTFTPTVNGPETGTLTLETDNPDVGTLTVALDGTGVDFIAALGLNRNGIFAEAPIGGSTTETLELSNEGAAPLEFEFASIPSWITEIDPASGTIAPGEELEVRLTMEPPGGGVYQDLLGLITNDPVLDQLGLHVVLAAGGAFSPPALTSPRYGFDDVPTDYTLAWLEPPGIDRYRVQVATDDGFTDLVEDEIVEDRAVTFGADAGETFFWRVRSLDSGTNESIWTLPFTFTTTTPTASEPEGAPEAAERVLGEVYPNPSRGSMTVPFTLPSSQAVTLEVYDVTGRLVSTLAS
ncbi:MAG: M43 family zinc metalloprotease, partial [Rubricoccaceae bacterium]|nr:M43 family zinc metalloprotease [Rubricoccaceae bacterium]